MKEQDWINLITISINVITIAVVWWFAYNQGVHDERKKNMPKTRRNVETGEKIKPPHYWNYRVGTRLQKHPLRDEMWREYLIIECHYKNDIPNAYGESVKMNGYEELDDMRSANSLMSTAFDKDIIDLDNFPNIFQSK